MPSPVLTSGQRFAMEGDLEASSTITSLTANASANTKGSYVEIEDSTLFNVSAIMLTFLNSNGGDYLIDIAVGAGGSEQVIISNLLWTASLFTGDNPSHVLFPIAIPAGTRVSARCQCTTGSRVTTLSVLFIAGSVLAGGKLQRVETSGAATGDSGGTSVDPGGTINTKGAYSQLSAALVHPIKWIIIAVGNQANTARTTCFWLIDIAIGAGGSEQVVIPNLSFISRTEDDMPRPHAVGLPVDIPAGVRLAVRAQCSINDATDRLIDVAVYGVS